MYLRPIGVCSGQIGIKLSAGCDCPLVDIIAPNAPHVAGGSFWLLRVIPGCPCLSVGSFLLRATPFTGSSENRWVEVSGMVRQVRFKVPEDREYQLYDRLYPLYFGGAEACSAAAPLRPAARL